MKGSQMTDAPLLIGPVDAGEPGLLYLLRICPTCECVQALARGFGRTPDELAAALEYVARGGEPLACWRCAYDAEAAT
jgi:hypothetical protein